MPAAAPRGAAAARKSVVPDPDLYAHSDDSDSDDSLAGDAAGNHHNNSSKPPSKRSRTSTAASTGNRGLVRKGSKGPQPTRGSVTTDTGRRRSTRLSNEHQPQDQTTTSTTIARAAGPKGKKRAKPEPDAAEEPETAAPIDEDHRPPAAASRAAAAASQRPTTKRPRLASAEPSSQPNTNESASATHPHPPAAAAPAHAPPPARRGFIPRAAADFATRVHKPPPAFSAALVDPTAAGDDDAAAEPFLFTTNPPTPYAKGAAAAAQRNASTQKQPTGRGKAPRTVPSTRHDSADDADASDAAVAATAGPSSSRHHRHTPPPKSSRGGGGGAQKPVAPIHVHETPVQVRNIAFRQGLPPGTPATIVRTARRSSARGSGKRGSSIGGGFEAVPHPQVADDKLYRSTDASDPIAKRLRSIISWAAQRTRDRLFRSVREDEMSVAQSAAKGVIDAFIEDEPSQSQDPARLPPDPHNESNAAKMQELEESYAAIAREQELRQSLEPTYQSFFDSRTQAQAEASTSYANLLPAAARSNPSAYAAALDLSVAAPTSLEEALALGRRVMQGELVQTGGGKTPAAAAKKGKGKNADDDAGGETSQEAMQRRVAEAQIETAAFRHQTHRLGAFTRVAAAYVAHRSSENHAALTRHNELGLAARSTAPATDDDAAGLAAAVPSAPATATAMLDPAGQTDAHMRATMDPRDLLRAIADSDTKRPRPS